ncbi:alpha/beta fold hydrolase [Nocardioides sp. LML1-1-1.1]|uniref:alpha/beta fold hydrolase n=1 Tax=Nocardioides sp. LML1-1-1.1 TaxID=3135248 RepID=UPI003413FA90
MNQPRTGSATYGGYRTRTVELDGSGPCLVLVHGFADSADTWNGVLAELAELGRSALAVDLPGFGDADLLQPGPVFPQLDRFLAGLVAEQTRYGDVILVGNSLGALASLRAADHGLPVRGVVAIGQPALGDNRLLRAFLATRTTLLVRILSLPLLAPAVLRRWLVAQAVQIFVYADRRAADPAVSARFADFITVRGGHGWVVRQARLLAAEVEDCYQFDQICCPLFVVHGAQDRVIPVNAAEALHSHVPHSDLVVMPTWGHCPQLDDPAGVARIVVDFADGCRSTQDRVG